MEPRDSSSGTAVSQRNRVLTGWWRVIFFIFCVGGIALSIVQIFYILNPFGISIYDISYYYLILASFLPPVFLIFPARGPSPRHKVPWYDGLLFLFAACSCIYFSFHGLDMFNEGWVFTSPVVPTSLGMVLCLLVVEAVRRTTGAILAVLALFFLFFPTFADLLPSPLTGMSFSFWKTMSVQSMGSDSLVGMPIWVFSTVLIGFMIFGVAMVVTGGGEFFIHFAYALLGRTRGGPAKVAILASGLFGSLSGSVVSNVLTTGAITIPAMKKIGFSSTFAAAVETNASTGGTLMPPVMGAVAFVMAIWLGIPYVTICAAALVPSLLYFFSLFMQIDAYAAKQGLAGTERTEVPSLIATLKQGWPSILGFSTLIWFLVHLRLEGEAPFYATLVLLIIGMLRRKSRLSLKDILSFFEQTGKVLVELVAVFAAVSLMIGGLTMTGVSSAFASEITALAGHSIFLLLVLGAFASLVLGTGMPVITCYIFLGLVLIPALTDLGLNTLAVHLFVMYCANLSFITPPVCIAAFAAAGLAGSSPMRTGFQAMRLGSIIFIIPFFFVLEPAMIGQAGTLWDTFYVVGTCGIGIALICGALEGYMWWLGKVGYLTRGIAALAGFMLALPGERSDIFGAILAALLFGVHVLRRERLKRNKGLLSPL